MGGEPPRFNCGAIAYQDSGQHGIRQRLHVRAQAAGGRWERRRWSEERRERGARQERLKARRRGYNFTLSAYADKNGAGPGGQAPSLLRGYAVEALFAPRLGARQGLPLPQRRVSRSGRGRATESRASTFALSHFRTFALPLTPKPSPPPAPPAPPPGAPPCAPPRSARAPRGRWRGARRQGCRAGSRSPRPCSPAAGSPRRG